MPFALFLKRYSTVRFNKIKPLRIICRYGCWLMGNLYCRFSTQHRHRIRMMEQGEIVDTYPEFYSNPPTLDWSKEDDAYSLLLDPSRFPVKSPQSYCAYKIFETTGSWPKADSKKRFTPKEWRVFLREAGYWEIDMIPSKNFFYVGISNYSPKPNGEVVWLERYEKYPEKVIVSRYDQKMFIPIVVRAGDFTWVKIDRRGYSPVRELNQKMVGVHATSL